MVSISPLKGRGLHPHREGLPYNPQVVIHLHTLFLFSRFSGLENRFWGGHFELKLVTFLTLSYIAVTYL